MGRARKKTYYSSFAEKTRPALLVASGLMLIFITFCYLTQQDSLFGITVWPIWVWFLIGFLITEFGWSRRTWKITLILSIAWLVVGLGFGEAGSLMNNKSWPSQEWLIARDHNDAVRVVTLNCGVGNSKAAAEVEELKPDIVLFQETPSRDDVKAIARRLYQNNAAVVWSADIAIIAKGRVIFTHAKDSWLIESRIRLASGMEVAVINVHLSPVSFRTDMWKPDYWKYMSHIRRQRRNEVDYIAGRISRLKSSIPVVLGGDFNTPAGDASLESLSSNLTDTFKISGKGWGPTFPNGMAFIRIDQIWTNERLYPASVVARRTVNSDHGMVICDLLIKGASAEGSGG